MSKADLRVDWATHEAAKYACEHWHYSKSIPPPPMVYVGIWEKGAYIGCVLFSRGANKSLGSQFGLEQTECCELVRIALKEHKSTVSRIMSIAVKFLRKSSPALRLVVSFADPAQNHHGGIYQANGWVYAGESSESYKYRDKAGREWHPRMVSKTGKKPVFGKVRKVIKTSECEKIKTPGKHRYLMPLDAEMRARVLPLSKPYPKRPKQAESADQAEPRRGSTDPDAPFSSGALNA